jgi:hypothetical protein
MILHGPREQLAHAIGGTRLVSAQQDVVARLIHVAPPQGVARPVTVRIDPDGAGSRQL